MPWNTNEERRQAIKGYRHRIDEAALDIKWIMVDMDDDGFDWLANRLQLVLDELGTWSAKDFERENHERI